MRSPPRGLLFLHALPLDERMWEEQLAAFAEPDPEAPNLYGLGGRTMDAWAAALLERFDGELVLVGASMGGYCALAVAQQAPERVRGLVLAGSRADADSPERRAGRADTIDLIRREGAAGLWESMRPKLFREDSDPSIVERARAIALEQDPDGLVRAVEAIRDRRDSTEVLLDLGDRAMVVLGDQDPFVSPDEVPARELHLLPGCGHLPSLEQPDRFRELLATALARWV